MEFFKEFGAMLASMGALLAIIVSLRKDIKGLITGKKRYSRFSDMDRMMDEGKKALRQCKRLMYSVTPPTFTVLHRWGYQRVLFESFFGNGQEYLEGVTLKNGFARKTEKQWLAYCEETVPDIMAAVSEGVDDAYNNDFFPMDRDTLRKHNYKHGAALCAPVVLDWLEKCRAIKKGEM